MAIAIRESYLQQSQITQMNETKATVRQLALRDTKHAVVLIMSPFLHASGEVPHIFAPTVDDLRSDLELLQDTVLQSLWREENPWEPCTYGPTWGQHFQDRIQAGIDILDRTTNKYSTFMNKEENQTIHDLQANGFLARLLDTRLGIAGTEETARQRTSIRNAILDDPTDTLTVLLLQLSPGYYDFLDDLAGAIAILLDEPPAESEPEPIIPGLLQP